VFEPASTPDDENGGGVDHVQATAPGEQFLDVKSCPGWAISRSLAQFEKALGTRLLEGAHSLADNDRKVKVLWSAQLLPGFYWSVLAIPVVRASSHTSRTQPASAQHRIVHTASLIGQVQFSILQETIDQPCVGTIVNTYTRLFGVMLITRMGR
jgi:hypothetical protein